MVRLDKYLCDAGLGTRSQVKNLLKAGRVTVDGVCVRDPGTKIDGQQVLFDGDPVRQPGRVVVMLNKPAGYVTATEDLREKTVMELLPPEMRHLGLRPVGRLDKDTEGLLLFTNDGDLLHRLISPKSRCPKTYYARHEGTAGREDVEAFCEGLTLSDGTKCLGAEMQILGQGECLVTVYEGKYHQVRRMLASRGLPVIYLERRMEGGLVLSGLDRGKCRELTEEEIGILSAKS